MAGGCGVVWWGVVWWGVMLWDVMWCGMVWCDTVWVGRESCTIWGRVTLEQSQIFQDFYRPVYEKSYLPIFAPMKRCTKGRLFMIRCVNFLILSSAILDMTTRLSSRESAAMNTEQTWWRIQGICRNWEPIGWRWCSSYVPSFDPSSVDSLVDIFKYLLIADFMNYELI